MYNNNSKFVSSSSVTTNDTIKATWDASGRSIAKTISAMSGKLGGYSATKKAVETAIKAAIKAEILEYKHSKAAKATNATSTKTVTASTDLAHAKNLVAKMTTTTPLGGQWIPTIEIDGEEVHASSFHTNTIIAAAIEAAIKAVEIGVPFASAAVAKATIGTKYADNVGIKCSEMAFGSKEAANIIIAAAAKAQKTRKGYYGFEIQGQNNGEIYTVGLTKALEADGHKFELAVAGIYGRYLASGEMNELVNAIYKLVDVLIMERNYNQNEIQIIAEPKRWFGKSATETVYRILESDAGKEFMREVKARKENQMGEVIDNHFYPTSDAYEAAMEADEAKLSQGDYLNYRDAVGGAETAPAMALRFLNYATNISKVSFVLNGMPATLALVANKHGLSVSSAQFKAAYRLAMGNEIADRAHASAMVNAIYQKMGGPAYLNGGKNLDCEETIKRLIEAFKNYEDIAKITPEGVDKEAVRIRQMLEDFKPFGQNNNGDDIIVKNDGTVIIIPAKSNKDLTEMYLGHIYKWGRNPEIKKAMWVAPSTRKAIAGGYAIGISDKPVVDSYIDDEDSKDFDLWKITESGIVYKELNELFDNLKKSESESELAEELRLYYNADDKFDAWQTKNNEKIRSLKEKICSIVGTWNESIVLAYADSLYAAANSAEELAKAGALLADLMPEGVILADGHRIDMRKHH